MRPKSHAVGNGNDSNTTPTKAVNGTTPSTGRRSTRKAAVKSYAEDDDDDDDFHPVLKDEDEGNDDIFAHDYTKIGRKRDDYEAGSDDDALVKSQAAKKVNGTIRTKTTTSDDEDDIVMAEIPAYDGPRHRLENENPKTQKMTTKTTFSMKKTTNNQRRRHARAPPNRRPRLLGPQRKRSEKRARRYKLSMILFQQYEPRRPHHETRTKNSIGRKLRITPPLHHRLMLARKRDLWALKTVLQA